MGRVKVKYTRTKTTTRKYYAKKGSSASKRCPTCGKYMTKG